jgi:hypothetical protein
MTHVRLPDSEQGQATFGALQDAVAELLNHAMSQLKPEVQAVIGKALEHGAELVVQVRVPASTVDIRLEVKGTAVNLLTISPKLQS